MLGLSLETDLFYLFLAFLSNSFTAKHLCSSSKDRWQITCTLGDGSHDRRVAELKQLLKPSPSALVSGWKTLLLYTFFEIVSG